MKCKVVIGLNSSWNLVNFRSGLIESLASRGYDVIGLAPTDSYSKKLQKINCRFIPIEFDTSGQNPIKDIFLFLKFLWILKQEKPSIFLGFTIKPNIYGSLAANLLGIPVINNIAGLGRSFDRQNNLSGIVTILYKISLFNSSQVFFQNQTDLKTFLDFGIVKENKSIVLPGSGVNLSKFKPIHKKNSEKKIKFLLASRLLWEKGIQEYVEAAKLIINKFSFVEFCILGFTDRNDPQYVQFKQLKQWDYDGIIKYLGFSDNVCSVISEVDCVVLPSYYKEGTPRVLLEAAAMGKPLITTDTPGCNDIVKHMYNGFLCKPKSPRDLAEKMVDFIKLNNKKKIEFGKNSRNIAETNYNENIIFENYQSSIKSILYLK